MAKTTVLSDKEKREKIQEVISNGIIDGIEQFVEERFPRSLEEIRAEMKEHLGALIAECIKKRHIEARRDLKKKGKL